MTSGSTSRGGGAVRDGSTDTPTLRSYVAVARRHKWLILQAVALVPFAAVALSLRQEERFRSSTEVLLHHQSLATVVTGTTEPAAYQQPDRLTRTQAELARAPAIASRVLTAQGLRDRSPQEFLEQSSVAADPNADLLHFTVTDGDRTLASFLSVEYAHQYVEYRRRIDTDAIARARAELGKRVRELRGVRETSPLYADLAGKEQQLRTLEALQASNATVVPTAATARRIQPRPVRNGIVGLALGLVLGLGLAFLREALDTRLRSAGELAERLDLPLLARVPEPPDGIRRRNGLVMIAESLGPHAEAFRILRTNLEFVNLVHGARTIMITSATEREGKSTTIANLATALAVAGKRVTLVDLDLRRPYLHEFFNLGDRPGLTEATLGHVGLADAIAHIAVSAPTHNGASRNGGAPTYPILEVLGSGRTPPNAGEFISTPQLSAVLDELRERSEFVLIDAPPLLHLGDAIALSGKVDGLILVSRLDVARRPLVDELRRVLDGSPAKKLGLVVTGAVDLETYGGYGSYAYAPAAEKAAVV